MFKGFSEDPGAGEEVLSYMALTGTCGPIGYVFRGCCLERDINFIKFCLKQGTVTQPCAVVSLLKPHHKLTFNQFANVQYIEIRNSL